MLATSIFMGATNAVAQTEPTIFDPETLLGDNPFTADTEKPFADGDMQGSFRYAGGGFYTYKYYTKPSFTTLNRGILKVAVPEFYSGLSINTEDSPVELIKVFVDADDARIHCRRPGVFNGTGYTPGVGPFPTLIMANWGPLPLEEGILPQSIFSPDEFGSRVAAAFLREGYAVCNTYTRDGINARELTRANFDILVNDNYLAVKKVSELSYVDKNSIVLFGRSGRADTVLELTSMINSADDGFTIVHTGLWEPAVILFTDILDEWDDRFITLYPLNERSHFRDCYYNGMSAFLNKSKVAGNFEGHTVECDTSIRPNTQGKIDNITTPLYMAAGTVDVAGNSPAYSIGGGTTVYPISDGLVPDLIAAKKKIRLGLFGDLPHSSVGFTTQEAVDSYDEALAYFIEFGEPEGEIDASVKPAYDIAWSAMQYYRFISDFRHQSTRFVKTKPVEWLSE